MLKFAQSIGMGGLGYLEILDDMSYKGPIDKFIPDDMKGEIAELAGLTAGDTIFFIADTPELAVRHRLQRYRAFIRRCKKPRHEDHGQGI